MKYKGLIISDIHVGAMDLEKLQEEFKCMVIDEIKSMDTLDFLVITGDFFDSKFYLGSKQAVTAHAMLDNLIEVCKEKGTVIRIVYGTESHENNQYDVLSVLKNNDEIKVIKYACEEELLPELHVLYLPEEHLTDKNVYYKDFFEGINKYDYVFGHGVIREVMKEAAVTLDNKETQNSTRKRVPVFNSAELSRICKGLVFFGHYHQMDNIDDKIFSVGSFSRWIHGEDTPKGYFITECNTKKETYDFEFIENTMADNYVTISFGYDHEIFKDDDSMIQSLERVEELINNDSFDHVRFVFNIPTDMEKPEAFINTIKERFKDIDKVKVSMTHGYIEEKKKYMKEQVKTENDKYAFINEDIPIENKVQEFIMVEYDKNIPLEDIDLFMNHPINEILDKIMDEIPDDTEELGFSITKM